MNGKTISLFVFLRQFTVSTLQRSSLGLPEAFYFI